MLLNYLATHPDAKVRFYATDMHLYLESDAAYLVLPRSCSRCAVYYYIGDRLQSSTNKPAINGAVHGLCKTTPNVVSSAAEAETGGIYHCACEAVPMIDALIKMVHPQDPNGVLITTDNSTAYGILASTMRTKLSKTYDMRYHWIKDRILKKQFQLRWDKGSNNLADYFTKHHLPAHHMSMRPLYLQANATLEGEGVLISRRLTANRSTITSLQHIME